jgi:large subunit ribosomal protein L24
MKIKKNDTVQINTGKDKGKKGKVLQVFPELNKVVVEGMNMMAKNVRPKKMGEKGQVVRYNAPLNASNVQIFCSSCSKGVRVGYLVDKAGKKVRICRTCKQAL